MPKFLVKASYTTEGTRGVLAEGGTGRRAAIQKLAADMGGKVEALYFAFGEADLYAITDFPDATTALAVSMRINSSGAVRTTTIQLISAEEVDAAVKVSVPYRAPGA
jgi:uncharacterized protein with GYD domain